MPFCRKCGQELKEEDKYCINCGTEQTREKPSCAILGTIFFDRGTSCICELGVCEKKKSQCGFGVCKKKRTMFWEDIDRLFIFTNMTYVYYIPTRENVEVNVIDTKGKVIKLGTSSWLNVKSQDRQAVSNVYDYVVSKIHERQWRRLLEDIGEGKRVSFNTFDVSSDTLYRKKAIGYEPIKISNIIKWQISNGNFYIEFIDNKGQSKRKSLNRVGYIPNVHLVQELLKPRSRD